MTQEKIKEIFEYNKKGFLVWKKPVSNRIKKGQRAGHFSTRGSTDINVRGERYKEHSLVWLYFKGYLPKRIDHADNNPRNNKIENLRECTQQQNCFNRTSSKKSLSGLKGVHKNGDKWQAQITFNYKKIYLGLFKNKFDAAKAYNLKAKELMKDFAKVNHV